MRKLALALLPVAFSVQAQEGEASNNIGSVADIIEFAEAQVEAFSEVSGYILYHRLEDPNAFEPVVQYLVAYVGTNGLILGADIWNDIVFDSGGVLNFSEGISDELFRQEHIYPYGGDTYTGGSSGGGDSGGSSGGGSGGGDGSGGNEGGVGGGDWDGSGGGGGGGGGGCYTSYEDDDITVTCVMN